MKKFKLVILSVILGLLLCACGEEEQISEIQQVRNNRIGTIASSYAIDIISDLAQDPEYDRLFGSLTYNEMAVEVSNMGLNTDGYALANAITSFQKGLEETGAILSKGEPVITVDGNEVIVDIEVICERRNADIEMIFNNDFYNPVMTSAAFNARYTMAEKMSKAGLNTVIGMGTVFVMLIVISFIISLFGLFSKQKKPDKTEEGINKAVEQIEKKETAELAELASNSELVAVIAAAIAAYEGTTSTDGFVVRSIKKIKRQ
ncbi:MAG: OadG family protein [Lachnospiraceae bacterium]|nr:OadG family protein [Lachnospiraceae bacterium]MBP1584535.1 OadG family protein [Lachnospiraceae bacterium]